MTELNGSVLTYDASMFPSLFASGRIGSHTIPNRVVMTAMGNHLANHDGTVSDEDVAFYAARAAGGVGLVITECTVVDWESGRSNLRGMALAEDRHIEPMSRLVDAVRAHGSKLVVQLYHPGRQGISFFNGNQPMPAPSAIEDAAVHQPVRAMTLDEIHAMVGKFVAAARRAQLAGADGVEVHGAHGYLIDEFLSPYSNRREDSYGGSFENRVRFLTEIVTGIREACGADFMLLVRLSVDEFLRTVGKPGEGIELDEGVRIAQHVASLGVDALDVSCGTYETQNTAWEPISFDQGWKTYLAQAVKDAVDVPVIGVGVVRDPAFGDQLVADGVMDFVGSARQHFADPDWARKAREGRVAQIRRCISCLFCMETLGTAPADGTAQCAINIEAGAETVLGDLSPVGQGRRVAVVGGGPAGLEAARVLAERGYAPVVLERTQELGGQLVLGCRPPHKEKITWLVDYYRAELERLGVEVRLGVSADVETVAALEPYAVMVAEGGRPVVPASIPGVGQDHVYDPIQVLGGRADIGAGARVVVVGSGMTGLETAEFLAARGAEVSVYEMADQIGPGQYMQNLLDVLGRLGEQGVALNPGHRLTAIDGRTVRFERTSDGEPVTATDVDAVVVALGTRSVRDLVDAVEQRFENVRVIGDSVATGRIRQAVESGYRAAYELA